jgi:hypothetical protein
LGLRRSFRRRFGRHAGLYLAGLLTILAVTYLVVPRVVSLIDAARAYNPFYYEPKDVGRR